jgi:hypothetical protein
MSDQPEPPVLAVDPGRDKCGVAVLAQDQVYLRALVPRPEIALTCRYLLGQFPEVQVIVGDQTTGREVSEEIRAACPGVSVQLVSEAYTTLEAQRLYWQDHPPGCWLRWLPAGLRLPPRPVDDYAALALARRYLAGRAGNTP